MKIRRNELKEFQRKTVAHAKNGDDVIVHSGTSTGKSYIYLYLSQTKRVVVLMPLNALIREQNKKYNADFLNGEVSFKERNIILNKFNDSDAGLILTTPETYKNLKLKNHILVIDEAHTILEYKHFRPTLKKIFEENEQQKIVMSATLEKNDYKYFKMYLNNPKIVVGYFKDNNINYTYRKIQRFDWQVLKQFNLEKTIIFCHHRMNTIQLSKLYPHSEAYHSKLNKNEKEEIINKFINGEIKTIFSTSCLAMGIDFDIDKVIHYDLPENYKSFVQKSGRTGRHNIGEVIILDSPFHVQKLGKFIRSNSQALESYQKMLDFLNRL